MVSTNKGRKVHLQHRVSTIFIYLFMSIEKNKGSQSGILLSTYISYTNRETLSGFNCTILVCTRNPCIVFQNEVINIIQITKSSLYRMVIKYANPLRDPVVANIVITPESVVDIQQK